MSTLRIRRFHRWHGLVMALILVMASASGLLHTLMTWLQDPPPPPRPALAVDLDQVTTGPQDIRAALAEESVTAISLRPIAGHPYWQVFAVGRSQPIYVDAANGARDDHADARYAEAIAQAHLGTAELRNAGYLTAFDAEYISIFRILPVWRFDADDGRGTRVYVSTMTGSVTRHTNDLKQLEAASFTYLHKWSFIPNKILRDLALGLANFSLIALAVMGVWLFVKTRPRPHDGANRPDQRSPGS